MVAISIFATVLDPYISTVFLLHARIQQQKE